MTAKKPHFTKAPAAAGKIEHPEDYSKVHVHPDIVAAAGLRNGMQPEHVHEAIKAAVIARGGHHAG